MKTLSIINILKSLPKLMRLGVSLAVAFSAATGYIIASSEISLIIVPIFLGVFLMSGGASALNQYQEHKIDALMSRTKNRPIPSGLISKNLGLTLAILIILAGVFVLYFFCGLIPALLGIINLFFYNILYTLLKRKTAFAVVPGSFTGAIPLLIGWTSSNSDMLDPTIIFICFFIYMWQIPHFWLLQIKYAEDYERAGLGVLQKLFNLNQIKRILYSWIVSTSFASLFFLFFGIIDSIALIISLILLNIWLVVSFYKIIFGSKEILQYKKAFIGINAFMLIVMIILIVDILT